MIEALKQWAFTLVITAVFGSIAMSVTISENSKSIKKYVKFACAVVALIVMISPLRGLFQVLPTLTNRLNNIESEFFDNSEHEESGRSGSVPRINELIIEKTSELLKDRISVAIYQKTGIKPENIYIYIKQKDNINNTGAENLRTEYAESGVEIEIEIEKIEIYMPANIENGINGANTLRETELYLRELLNCDIVIIDAYDKTDKTDKIDETDETDEITAGE